MAAINPRDLSGTDAIKVLRCFGINAQNALTYLNEAKYNSLEAAKRANLNCCIMAANALLQLHHAKDQTTALGEFIMKMTTIQNMCAETDVLAIGRHDMTAFTSALASISYSIDERQDMLEQFNAMKNESSSFNPASIIQMVLYFTFSSDPENAAKLCAEFIRNNSRDLPVQFQTVFPNATRHVLARIPVYTPANVPVRVPLSPFSFTKGIPFTQSAPTWNVPTKTFAPQTMSQAPFKPIPSAPAKEIAPVNVESMLEHLADLRQILPTLVGSERKPVEDEIRELEVAVEQALASDEGHSAWDEKKEAQSQWQQPLIDLTPAYAPAYSQAESTDTESDAFLLAQIHAVYGP